MQSIRVFEINLCGDNDQSSDTEQSSDTDQSDDTNHCSADQSSDTDYCSADQSGDCDHCSAVQTSKTGADQSSDIDYCSADQSGDSDHCSADQSSNIGVDQSSHTAVPIRAVTPITAVLIEMAVLENFMKDVTIIAVQRFFTMKNCLVCSEEVDVDGQFAKCTKCHTIQLTAKCGSVIFSSNYVTGSGRHEKDDMGA